LSPDNTNPTFQASHAEVHARSARLWVNMFHGSFRFLQGKAHEGGANKINIKNWATKFAGVHGIERAVFTLFGQGPRLWLHEPVRATSRQICQSAYQEMRETAFDTATAHSLQNKSGCGGHDTMPGRTTSSKIQRQAALLAKLERCLENSDGRKNLLEARFYREEPHQRILKRHDTASIKMQCCSCCS